MAYQDGTFTSAVQDGAYRKWYPFVNSPTKDTNTEGSIYSYVVLAANYTPAAANATATHSNTQYLVAESDLSVEGGLARFTRTFCEVPGPQVYYSTLVINKPAFPSNDYGGAYVDSTSTTATANIWSQYVTSDAIATRVINSGTFTLTYNTSTTAEMAYNESDANIASAFNALADAVSDGVTVSVQNDLDTASDNELTLTKLTGAGLSPLTSWTPNFAAGTVTNTSVLTSQAKFWAAPNVVTITETAHGLTTNAQIRYYSTTPSGAGTAATVTNVDANTFTIPTTSASNVPNPVYYRTLLRTYTPGADRVLAKITETFYLPGVTANISTPEDIPIPNLAINDTQLLSLVVGSATGWQDYDADPLKGWPNDASPMYVQRVQQINVDDL